MKKIKLLLPLTLLLGLFQPVYAQFGSRAVAIQEIQKRDLIVIIGKMDDKVMKKIEKKGNSDLTSTYQTLIDNFNQNMKYAVENFWKFTTGQIIYKTVEEYQELMNDKANASKYAVMCCTSGGYEIGLGQFDWQIDDKGNSMTGSVVSFSVTLPDLKGGNLYDYKVTLGELVPGKASLICAMEREKTWYTALLKNHLMKPNSESDEMIKNNQHNLVSKTLLIRDKDLGEDVKPAQIKASYPLLFKIVSEDDMNKSIMAKDSNYAYVGLVLGGTGSEVHFYVVDCADGGFLGQSGAGTGIQIGSHKINPKKLGASNLKDFCKDISPADMKKKKH